MRVLVYHVAIDHEDEVKRSSGGRVRSGEDGHGRSIWLGGQSLILNDKASDEGCFLPGRGIRMPGGEIVILNCSNIAPRFV